MKEYQGKPQGSLSAYKISGDGKLQLLNRVPPVEQIRAT